MTTLNEALRRLNFTPVATPEIIINVTLGNRGDCDGQGRGEGIIVGATKGEYSNRRSYAVLARRHGALHLNDCDQFGYSTCALVVDDVGDLDVSMLEDVINSR